MKNLIKRADVDPDNSKVMLTFSEKVSLSNRNVPDYDLITRLTVSGVTYTIGSIVPDPANDTESKKWIVSYTGTSMKKKKGTVIDPDEVVVVIETKETSGSRSAPKGRKVTTKKQTKKKVTKSSPVKKKSKKK
jgi:hypothetical protein